MEENETTSMRRSQSEALKEAVRNGTNTAICRLLGSSWKVQSSSDFTLCDDAFRNLLMAEAIDRGHCAVVEILIHHGFDARGHHQETPHLHRAITFGKEDIVKVLVYSGADVTSQSHVTGKTSLHLAAASSISNSYEDILEFLVSHGQKSGMVSSFERSSTKQSSCHLNRATNGYDKNDFLNRNLSEDESCNSKNQQEGQSVDMGTLEDNKNNNSGGFTSDKFTGEFGRGDTSIYDHSSGTSSCDFLETRDKIQGNTALHVACVYNNDKAALCLLRLGANPNPLNMHGDTPLAKLLQPVTRRADDDHNRSRLTLARRLVAMGLVVEKKYTRGESVHSTANGIASGPRSVKVTSGCGSARSTSGPVSSRTANLINSSSDFDLSSEVNQNDLDRAIEVERIYEEVKSESGIVAQSRSKNEYTKSLGVAACADDMAGNGLVGVQDYAMSIARDRRVGAVRTACPGDQNKSLKLHQEPPSREDLEAKLEALCVFHSEDSPQDDPEIPSPPYENVSAPRSFDLTSSEYSRLIPKFESLVTQLSRHRKNRDTDFKPGAASYAESLTKARGSTTRKADTSVVSQAANEKHRSKLSESRLEKERKYNPWNTRRGLSESEKDTVDKYIEGNRESTFHSQILDFKKPNSKDLSNDDVFDNKVNPSVDISGVADPTSSRSRHQKFRSTHSSLSSLPLNGRVIATKRQGSKLESECLRVRQKSTPNYTHKSLIFGNNKNDVPSRNRNRSLPTGLETNMETGASRASSTRRPLKEIKDIPSMAHINSTRREPVQRNRETQNRHEHVQSNGEVQTRQEPVQRHRNTQIHNEPVQRNRGERKKEPSPNEMVGKFKFPSRDERIRLRFKRLLGELSATLTLQQLCRLAILRSLTGKSVTGSVDKLGLPVLMQKFLLRDDLY